MISISGCKLHNTQPLVLIAGPCVIENNVLPRKIAGALVRISHRLNIKIIFKASYDKANRSSFRSFRGIGLSPGLAVLKQIKKEFRIPVMTDIHSPAEAEAAASVCDIIQIPAFLCRQTDLLVAAGKTGKAVNIKKGPFMAPEDMINAIKKVESAGNNNSMVTERGYSFGYHNLVVDMRSLEIMKRFGVPVVFDATHSVQLPGGLGDRTGGERQFIFPLARAAVAVGIAAVFFETHPNPGKALSDGPNAVQLQKLEAIVKKLMQIDKVIKN